ncbi:predicted protein [Uncinocarpus reesii 1704]|uniref:Uncharacterized protein n=1 Tax=Uncinocarpus reesii (strain UAMH 1704) TaxID=336963 RepID=C4JZ72_UNCRE|nr:uncharacterized protein UREG_07473 [Uncinocarpus reesii 1704]EEP82608.1 predicted protein [Uncinocarpus reesii 1704]
MTSWPNLPRHPRQDPYKKKKKIKTKKGGKKKERSAGSSSQMRDEDVRRGAFGLGSPVQQKSQGPDSKFPLFQNHVFQTQDA